MSELDLDAIERRIGMVNSGPTFDVSEIRALIAEVRRLRVLPPVLVDTHATPDDVRWAQRIAALGWPWRTGGSAATLGRTIYAMPPGSTHRQGEVLIGMMDTGALAAHIVEAHNAHLRDSSSP